MRRALRLGFLAAVPLLGGCWLVIGESFTDYLQTTGGDGGADAVVPADGGADVAAPDGAPHPIDDCTPSFALLNGITYPDHAGPPLEITTQGNRNFDTDTDPLCASPSDPVCVVVVTSLHIGTSATLAVFGKRPLAIVAVHDVILDDNGVLNVAGSDTGGVPGPGPHTQGTPQGRGGGGGNAEPGAGSCSANNGGSTIPNPTLVGGGNGGGNDDPRLTCQKAGMGGGALQLVSLCGKIQLSGGIDASGGGGGGGAAGDPACPDALGGGAGGTVWIQAGKGMFSVNAATGGGVNLAGGGGGGGACNGGGAWTPGGDGSRASAGLGASCAAANGPTGGDGGAGGNSPSPPDPGGNVTAGAMGTATCGGGGGARGYLLLSGTNCTPGMTNGECHEVP